VRGLLVKTSRNLILSTLFIWVSAGVGVTQQSSSPVEAGKAPAKVYDEGPDVVAPQLIPMERAIPDASACARDIDDEVTLSLIVDSDGKPRDVTLINPVGTPIERLAKRVVEQDTFKPGTLKGEAVEMRLKARVSIEGCYANKTDANGNASEVFRLKAQPVQLFAAKLTATETDHEADKIGAAGTPELHKVGNGVSPPVPLNFVEAEFSDEARRAHFEGVCLVSLIVDTHGNPVNLRVVRSLGHGLDEKALEAVRKWHFKPAMKAGVPVPVMITVEVNFRL